MNLRERMFPLLLFLTVNLVVPVTVQAEEKSGLFKLGRATAYASYCGYRSIVTELRGRFGKYDDFKAGYRSKHRLFSADFVTGVPCGHYEDVLSEFLEKLREDNTQQ